MKIDDLGGLSFTALQIIAFVGNLQDFAIFDCHNLGFGVVLILSVIQWVIHSDDIPIDVDGVSNLAILCGLSLMTGIHSVCWDLKHQKKENGNGLRFVFQHSSMLLTIHQIKTRQNLGMHTVFSLPLTRRLVCDISPAPTSNPAFHQIQLLFGDQNVVSCCLVGPHHNNLNIYDWKEHPNDNGPSFLCCRNEFVLIWKMKSWRLYDFYSKALRLYVIRINYEIFTKNEKK